MLREKEHGLWAPGDVFGWIPDPDASWELPGCGMSTGENDPSHWFSVLVAFQNPRRQVLKENADAWAPPAEKEISSDRMAMGP